MEKKAARSLALSLRKNKDKHFCEEAVIHSIISSNVLKKYKNIGIYYPIGDEMNVLKLLSYYPDKSFYLPIIRENKLSFINYKLGDELKDGIFNTKEPIGKITPRDKIECFIIPCVAVSKDYKRIGYGKGYYDRYLEGYQGYKIGILYQDSFLDIDTEIHDLMLDTLFMG